MYRSLRYIEEAGVYAYTEYTPSLDKYSDSGSVAPWAKEAMEFMEALGQGSYRNCFETASQASNSLKNSGKDLATQLSSSISTGLPLPSETTLRAITMRWSWCEL